MTKALSLHPDVLKRLSALARKERADCLLALCDLSEAFGRPHVHSGLSVRKLGASVFECRAGLDLRFVFLDRGGDLFVFFLGDHDEVTKLLRGGRYR